MGGFFGFGRTYGAIAHFEADSVETLETDWPAVLEQTAVWRAHRRERALALHLHLLVPKAMAWEAIGFLGRKLTASAAELPAEFAGLRVESVVFGTPGNVVFLGMTLNSEATQKPQG